MSNIYEALEQAQREKNGLGTVDKIPLAKDPTTGKVPQLHEHVERPVCLAGEEVITNLYRTIDVMLPEQSRKTIQFISVQQGEGVSTIVHEVARTASGRLGKKVLILNAIRHNSERTLSDMQWTGPNIMRKNGGVMGTACFQTSNANLCIAYLPIGTDAGSGFYDLKAAGAFLTDLGQHFDLILIDSPPLSEEPGSVDMVRYADGVILVLEAERTKWFVAENVKEKILKNGGNILGVVFNKRRYHIPKFIYQWLY
jgi:Mrp family chromosome partitioning ATPase